MGNETVIPKTKNEEEEYGYTYEDGRTYNQTINFNGPVTTVIIRQYGQPPKPPIPPNP